MGLYTNYGKYRLLRVISRVRGVVSMLTMVYKPTNITVEAPPCMNLDNDMILKDSN